MKLFLRMSLILLLSSAVLAQDGRFNPEKVRMPARAGQFYPDSRYELIDMIDGFLSRAEPVEVEGRITGLWVPHAGYVFSGQVAANAYRLVQGVPYDAVIIIGPSHYVGLRGASIGDWEAYKTPLGYAVVDTVLVRDLRTSTPFISNVPEAHRYEHSVEVQVPFVQRVLPGVPIVPMVIGADISYGDARKIAKSIAQEFGDRRVLLVASSDMSHFPSYRDAYDVDLRVLDKVAEFDARGVMDLSRAIVRENISGLDCAMCGSAALTTVMLAQEELGSTFVKTLPYANSGDITGERHRVVGYGAAVFYGEGQENDGGSEDMLEDIPFSKEEKKKLFQVARESIMAALEKGKQPEFSISEENLQVKRGVFVTLMNHGRLRGCIGHFAPDYALWEIVVQMAMAAATQDYRFAYDPVTPSEMEDIDIKISVLSELQKIGSVEEIEVGKHGIWVVQGGRSGTYLPEVATEMGWDRIEFLEHCCAEKAGLPKDAWKRGAEIYIYSSQILSEAEL